MNELTQCREHGTIGRSYFRWPVASMKQRVMAGCCTTLETDYLYTIAVYGGVGVPVDSAVFKTVGGLLGAVSGRFDSDTPLLFWT